MRADFPAPGLMLDFEPRKSPVDGSWIASRKALSAHNKRHGVIDIGDEPFTPNYRKPHEPLSDGEWNDLMRQAEHEVNGWRRPYGATNRSLIMPRYDICR